jgi:ferredoxin
MKNRPRSFLIKPSTRKFIREARRTPGFSWFDLLHGYVYGRWTYLYIEIGVGEHPLSKKLGPLLGRLAGLLLRKRPSDQAPEQEISPATGQEAPNQVNFADTYHGKVLPVGAARQLVLVNEDIQLPDLEQVIPYKRARAIILQNPDHIVVLECPCRTARPDPCLPLDVCLIVGEPFASFVIEHHPERSRWITQAQAADILQAEDERGHVHHAFFKDAMLGRFYAICNCCSCCCGAMQAQRNGSPMLASSGYVSQVDETLCQGCGICVNYCQFGALSVPNGYSNVDIARCMGCGVCVSQCENGALSLRREESKGVPLELLTLKQSTNNQQTLITP